MNIAKNHLGRLLVGLFLLGSIAAWMPVQAASYTYTRIDYPGSEGETKAWGLNNMGKIVGTTFSSSFLYDARTMAYEALPSPPDKESGTVLNINDRGVMVGSAFESGVSSGLILRRGVFTTFAHPDYEHTLARAINNNGLITGYLENQNPYLSAGFIYNPKDSSFVEFLPSTLSPTIAQGINNKGQAVGYYRESDLPFTRYGFRRDMSGDITLFAVNDSASNRARDITDYGAIVGDFRDQDTVTKGFVVCLTDGSGVQDLSVAPEDLLEVPAEWAPSGFSVIATIPEGSDNKGRVSGIWQAVDEDFNVYEGGFLATPDKQGACP